MAAVTEAWESHVMRI